MRQTGSRLRIGLLGAKGRMGQAIAKIVADEVSTQAELTALIDREESARLGSFLDKVDVLIDVSLPTATVETLATLQKLKLSLPFVIGCTGWTPQQKEAVIAYSEQAATVLSANFSPGVTLLLGLVEQAAPLLKHWGYEAVIHEVHHNRKLDAPSGTAKAILEKMAGLKATVHSSRVGNIVGTHEVQFVGPADVLSLTHEALDRSIFARGAVLAAQWAAQAKPGLYSMKDVVFG